MSSSEIPQACFFAGVGGSGMSALAQYLVRRGGRAGGSDRAFDVGERGEIRAALEAAGVAIHPQDGSGVAGHDALVVSTAVEETVPDVRAARAADVPLLHRSELLARFVARERTVAVTGTSGKSTVVAMVFAILRAAGRRPGVITGGPLVELRDEGLLGNAWAEPDGEWLVIEADESDGSLVRYRPWCGVALNLQRDHKEPAEVAEMFRVFRGRTTGPFVAGEEAELDFLGADLRFGFGTGADVRGTDLELGPDRTAFRVDGAPFEVPAPGRHTASNALAAVAAARAADVPLDVAAEALRVFRGVSRRFEVVGDAGGVLVVDDFAHNPEKLRAAMAAARLRTGAGGRVLAFFQPHGYGPTRFLFDDLVTAFAEALLDGDVLWLPPIYYAGGTVERAVESTDLSRGIRAAGADARDLAHRDELPAAVAAAARPGDVVMVMGARDPALSDLARAVLAAVEGA